MQDVALHAKRRDARCVGSAGQEIEVGERHGDEHSMLE
jgi:hypothetical protein